MMNHTVNLTPDLDEFVLTRVEGGRYSSTSEMIHAALLALKREERTADGKHSVHRITPAKDDVADSHNREAYRRLWHMQFESEWSGSK
jgi:putative addiction module CopG family antidote